MIIPCRDAPNRAFVHIGMFDGTLARSRSGAADRPRFSRSSSGLEPVQGFFDLGLARESLIPAVTLLLDDFLGCATDEIRIAEFGVDLADIRCDLLDFLLESHAL